MKRYIKQNQEVDAAKSAPSLHSTFDGLDDRFSFDLDDEFQIYLDTTTAEIVCYTFDSHVFGNGAGLVYDVAVAVPEDVAHWDIQRDIERNLERYIQEETDGTDYTGWVEDYDITDSGVSADYTLPEDVTDTCKIYVYSICVIPYQNIGPDGEYGIDYGTEEYLDHITKGTPFPPEYED